MLARLVGARTVNMLFRKLEEIRLSFWIEGRCGRVSVRSAALRKNFWHDTPACFTWETVNMGWARGAEYYFGRPLSTFTAEDADKAALLAGAVKVGSVLRAQRAPDRAESWIAGIKSWR